MRHAGAQREHRSLHAVLAQMVLPARLPRAWCPANAHDYIKKRWIMTTRQVLTAIILVACGDASSSQSNATSNRPLSADTTKALTAAEQTLNDALLRADWKTIEEIYADDIVFTNADGSVSHKSDSVRAIQSGDAKFASIEMSGVYVQDLGNVGVVTGR